MITALWHGALTMPALNDQPCINGFTSAFPRTESTGSLPCLARQPQLYRAARLACNRYAINLGATSMVAVLAATVCHRFTNVIVMPYWASVCLRFHFPSGRS